jgi:hypothetical protein
MCREREHRALLAWVGENLAQVRRSVYEQRLLYWSLATAFVIGLAAHVGVYLLKSSVTTQLSRQAALGLAEHIGLPGGQRGAAGLRGRATSSGSITRSPLVVATRPQGDRGSRSAFPCLYRPGHRSEPTTTDRHGSS